MVECFLYANSYLNQFLSFLFSSFFFFLLFPSHCSTVFVSHNLFFFNSKMKEKEKENVLLVILFYILLKI